MNQRQLKQFEMNDFPAVVLAKVFHFFSMPEKAGMKLICKKWKFVIETYNRPQSLCLYSTDYPSNERWCSTGQRVAENEMFYLKFDFEDSSRFSFKINFFQNLQSVYLYGLFHKVDHFLEEVSQLTKLKALMIDDYEIKSAILSSFSLENLFLKCHDFTGIERTDLNPDRFDLTKFPKLKLKLNTPNLTRLGLWIKRGHYATNDDEQFEFGFPLKIKHLQCLRFNSNLSQLKNLETISCQEILSEDFRLHDFRSLVKLEIYPNSEEQLQLVKELLKERDNLSRGGLDRPLQIVVSGFEDQLVSCVKKRLGSEEIELTPAYLEQAERNHSDFIGTALWEATIEIDSLLKYADKIPSLFERYPNVSSIIETDYFNAAPVELKVRDEAFQSRLLELFKKSRTQSVTIHRMNLSQRFYFQLAAIESIKSLDIRNYNAKTFDLNCFLECKALKVLWIGFPTISTEFLCKMFKRLKFLTSFHYGTSGSEFHVDIKFDLRNPATPFYFSYDLYGENRVGFFLGEPLASDSKDCKDVDDLEKAINQIKEDKTINIFLSS